MANKSPAERVQEEAALFALGALEPEEAERFEARLRAGCPLCRSELADCERALAHLALAPRVDPPADLRRRLLERATEDRGEPKQASLAEATIVRATNANWRTAPIPGVEVRSLLGRQTMLVRMAPRTVYPAHDHALAEQCLVLEGSVTSNGVTATQGDYVYMPAGSSHDPLYSEEGCVLFIAYTA